MWNLLNLQLWNEFESECDPLRFVGLNNYVFNFLFSNLFCCRTKWLLQLLTVPDFPDNLQIFRNISRPSICIHVWWYNNWTDVKQHAYYCICKHSKTHKNTVVNYYFSRLSFHGVLGILKFVVLSPCNVHIIANCNTKTCYVLNLHIIQITW